MRTALIILGGFMLLGLCVLVGRLAGEPGTHSVVTAVKVFLLLWLAAALYNMYMGVTSAGYSVSEELPIFLVIFALPAAAAVFLWWKFS